MSKYIGKLVLVRCYGAGVHIGILESADGKNISLTEARRLWRWRGANTLSEVALHGVSKDYSRLSEPVSIELHDAIETIPVAAAARASLTGSRWPT